MAGAVIVFFAFCLRLSVPASAAIQGRFLPTGTQIKATITNAIFSYNLEAPVTAEIENDARYCNPLALDDCAEVALPRKTKFLGRAMILKSNNRVNIDFHRAVLPNGEEVQISAVALWPDGSSGIIGKVKKHKDSLVASAALKGAIAGAAVAVSGSENPIAASSAQALADESIREIDLSREKVDTSIEVAAFTRCLIYLTQRFEQVPDQRKEGRDSLKDSQDTKARSLP